MGVVTKVLMILAAAIAIVCFVLPLAENPRVTSNNLGEKEKVTISFTFIGVFVICALGLCAAISFCCCSSGIVCGIIMLVLGVAAAVCALIALITYYQAYLFGVDKLQNDAWLFGAFISSLHVILLSIAYMF